MQIVAGTCRGMKVLTPKGETTRPTSAKAREAIMQMLSEQLPEGFFVDFFAGSGAMGLEAISRGCARCYFVEHDRNALAAIEKNLAEVERRLKAQQIEGQRWHILRQKAERSLPYIFSQIREFKGEDVILYADPPYGLPTLQWLNGFLQEFARERLSQQVTLVVESASEDAEAVGHVFAAHEQEWEKLKERDYGKAVVHFYRSYIHKS
jgi:16S rRNA (guanine(966)-N(2))-methyltransferase RsmD